MISLDDAITNGNLEEVKICINTFGVYNNGGHGYYNLLCRSNNLNHTEITKFLLNSGKKDTIKKKELIPSKTALHHAVDYKNIKIIEILVDHGANINARNGCGSSPLIFAIRKGNAKMIDVLLKRESHNNGNSSLYLAAERALNNIREKFSSVNSKTREGLSPLHFADVNARTNNMISLLYMAVQNCHKGAANFLLYHKDKINADPNNQEIIFKDCNVCMGLSMIFEDILNSCPDTNNANNEHSYENNTKIVENLLKYGFPVEFDDKNQIVLLQNDLKMEYIKILQNLTKYHELELDCDKEQDIIFQISSGNKEVELAKILFTHKPNVNSTEKTKIPQIFYSTENSDLNMTKLMLLHGAKNNLYFHKISYQKKDANIVVDLLLHEDCTFKEYTPLETGVYLGNVQAIEMLLENGVNVNSKRENGDTPLHIAARTWHRPADVLKILLENGADVHSKNKDGDTPLHVASRGIKSEISILLQHGSDVDSKNLTGSTPIDIAIKCGNSKAIKVLLEFGSDISNCGINFEYTIPEQPKHRFCFGSTEGPTVPKYLRVLLLHLVKLRTANLYLSEKHQSIIGLVDKRDYYFYNELKSYEIKCENEIQNLKLEKITNNQINLYDLLTKSIQSLTRYANNEVIIRTFETGDYKEKFPIYASIIERNLKRSLLYEKAQEFFYNYFGLPYDCSEQILQYLSHVDIESILNT